MKTPAVYMIGTGPGDPGLITVHGLECLSRADVEGANTDPHLSVGHLLLLPDAGQERV